ncbi:prepilin-type N-terminal cleavage/methylation domain-containing protein [Opitutaceae bacterium TAV1]|nr:prepilin-type N-terminal cleavage/methylation domain-containing protein [Opitutaceae bacterium TAV1]
MKTRIHPCCQAGSTRFAFTLIELLTVIAIIGILAAIIIPTVGAVRQSARAAQCKSNLRQIAIAAQMWSADNKGMIVPCADPKEADGGPYGGKWPVLLAKYLGREATNSPMQSAKDLSIVVCPAIPDVWGYGFNYVSLSPWLSGSTYQLVPLSAVERPSRVVMFTDEHVEDSTGAKKWQSYVRPATYSGGDGRWDDNPQDLYTISFRHRGTCNVAWVDAHVSTERPNTDFTDGDKSKELWGQKPDGKSMWLP